MGNAMKRILPVLAVLGLGLYSAERADADPVVYSATDPGVTSVNPSSSSVIESGIFNTAASGVGTLSTTITFESLTLGTFTSLSLGQGVTVTSVHNEQGVADTVGETTGFNTTPGGSKFLEVIASSNPGGYVFNFATPISAFGAFFTGVGTAAGSVRLGFSDETSESITISGSNPGGAEFLGFTDSGAFISSISVEIYTDTNDAFGIDDVRFAVVPEPSSVVLALTALPIGLGWLGVRRRLARLTTR